MMFLACGANVCHECLPQLISCYCGKPWCDEDDDILFLRSHYEQVNRNLTDAKKELEGLRKTSKRRRKDSHKPVVVVEESGSGSGSSLQEAECDVPSFLPPP